jgi:O-antigen ligase
MFDPHFWTYTLQHQKTPMGTYYYDILPAVSGTNPGHVHNEYLEVYCEQGLVGLVALVALMGFFLFYGYLRLMRESDPSRAFYLLALMGALALTLVDAAFGFPWRLPVSIIVVSIVLAMLYDRIYESSEEKTA